MINAIEPSTHESVNMHISDREQVEAASEKDIDVYLACH